MEHLAQFLQSQRLLVLATQGDPVWVTNLLYCFGKDMKLYFISGIDTEHSQHIMARPSVAFSTAWYNKNDHTDRKAVQGKGTCRMAVLDEEINEGVTLHNKNYPEFAERLTVDYIKSADNSSEVWVVEPYYIKHWDDELYGSNGTKEFTF